MFRRVGFPLLFNGLCEEGEFYEKTSAHFYAMARACMGPYIELHSWMDEDEEEHLAICFSWGTADIPLYYTVTIRWKRVGLFIKPDVIMTAVTRSQRPKQRKPGLWSRGMTGHPGIADLDIPKDSPEKDVLDLASNVGCMKFLYRRTFPFTRKNLRSRLQSIAKEYAEELQPFMVATLFATDLNRLGSIEISRGMSPLARRIYPRLVTMPVGSASLVQPMKSPTNLIYHMRTKMVHQKPSWWRAGWRFLTVCFKDFLAGVAGKLYFWLLKRRLKSPGPSWLVRASDLEATQGLL